MAETLHYNGLPAVRWRSRDGASAIATLQGAHVVSWIPAGGTECLYVSERSPFEAGRAIRGGIPVVFPQFAERGPLPKHGLARTREWRLEGVAEEASGSRVSFALDGLPEAQWPHAFGLELVATIAGARLEVELRVANRGDTSFTFAAALHTYFRVTDHAAVSLEGLLPEPVTAAQPIDRIFFAAPRTTRLADAARTFRIEQRGFADTVVWNPGRATTATMADMPPEGFRHMLCVEAAAIEPPVALQPGARWSGSQSISCG